MQQRLGREKLLEAFEMWTWRKMLKSKIQLDRQGDKWRGVGTCQWS